MSDNNFSQGHQVNCTRYFVIIQDYAINLSEQLGLRGPKTAKTLGKPLDPEDLERLREEQVHQLYELMVSATGQSKEGEDSKLENIKKT